MLTVQEVNQWLGRCAQDSYGEPLGEIVGAMLDRETGTPEWLIVSDGEREQGLLVPVGGAAPTGRQIRVVATSDDVRCAPIARVGGVLDVEGKRRAAEHYGLALDTDASPTGQLRDPGQMRPAGAPGTAGMAERGEPAEPGESSPRSRAKTEQRRGIVSGLRAAHAIEQASLKLLAAMRWRAQDEELVHDIALHHKQTNRHAERLRERLDELDAWRARPLDWAGKTFAYVRSQAGRLRSQPDPHDVRAAHAFELREIDMYEGLERLAREAGDERTAAVCAHNRADEVAMAMTLRNSRLWADPGPRRDEHSPFAAPEDLAETSPES